jgi:hypothetical protein
MRTILKYKSFANLSNPLIEKCTPSYLTAAKLIKSCPGKGVHYMK